MIEKIEKFIADNELNFTDTGSGLNGNCIILAGYLDYLENYADVKEFDSMHMGAVLHLMPSLKAKDEMDRTHTYACRNRYGKKWSTSDYKSMYKY
jgi:hypothetical protein